MSTPSKMHNNHHVNRATPPTNGGARTPHPIQARVPAPKSGAPGGSRAPAPPTPNPRTQPVGRPPAAKPQVHGSHKVTQLTQADISRMTSAVSKQHGGALPKDSYVAELQSRFDKREASSSAKAPEPAAAPKPQEARREPLPRKGHGKR
jgi:hypothetical protein